MIDNARLEEILMRLARRYARPLAFPGWERPGDYTGRLSDLATALAEYNLLVMAADPGNGAAADVASRITVWVEGYVRLYDLLCGALFPSFAGRQAFYADERQPPVIVLNGEAAPVLMMMAGYVAPFIVSRQGANVSDFEIRGLIDLVLDELEAHDLPHAELRQLRESAMAQLRQMLASPVRQLHLTAPVAALARNFDVGATPIDPAPVPQNVPDVAPAPAPAPGALPEMPPEFLPEQDLLVHPDAGAAEESRPFAASIPIFFEPQPRPKRRPPVPDLPEDLK